MPRIYDDILVKCPFFMHNGKRNVVCEGVTDDSTISLRFTTEGGRNKQRRIFCDNDYTKCEIYRMLEEKYGE
jgi:hypothetical protein